MIWGPSFRESLLERGFHGSQSDGGGGGWVATGEISLDPLPACPSLLNLLQLLRWKIVLQADTDSEPMGRKCFVNSKYNYWTIIQEKNIIRF